MREPATILRGLLDQLPSGWAWTREPDSITGRVLTPLAAEASRFEGRAEALLAEATPSTTVELLGDYERVLGPDPCLGATHATFDERRLSVHMRWTARGGASRQHMVELAAALGYLITIEEFRPSRAGRFRAGQRIAPERVQFTWRVTLPRTRAVRFRAGRSRAGDRLLTFGIPWLQCVLTRAAPVHTNLVFRNAPPRAPG